MQLKSVDKPKELNSPFESRESGAVPQPEIIASSPGQEPDARSRASDHFLVRGTRAQPLSNPRNIFESILGDVDRRKQILETELTPWRMICALDITSQNGFSYIGTGWFVAPRTVITAGHCVFDPVELGGWARQITVIPGRNGDAPVPFGQSTSSNFSTTDRWEEAQDADFDYAAIHLDEDLGTAVGTFGIGALPDEDLQNRLLNISGYPVSPGGGMSQYFHANRIKALTPRRLFYDIDTLGGQSGSPVWAYLDGSDNPVVVGIHAYGIGGVPAGLNVVANSGPRILPEVMNVIREWIQRGT
jgi:glutamyl endopeptidase